MTEFDPAQHRMVPQQRWFDDFSLGERFVIPSRTMTSAVFAAFQTASGDTHPIHYDVEYCRARGMPNLLAHGFQTLIHTAPGSGLFPYMVEESLVGFLEQSSRFLKPVFADDTIYPALEDGAGARAQHGRGGAAQHRVQSAPRAGAGRIAEISHSAAAVPVITDRAGGPEFSNRPLVAKAAKNPHKLRLFADLTLSKGCRTGAPALPIAHEIP